MFLVVPVVTAALLTVPMTSFSVTYKHTCKHQYTIPTPHTANYSTRIHQISTTNKYLPIMISAKAKIDILASVHSQVHEYF